MVSRYILDIVSVCAFLCVYVDIFTFFSLFGPHHSNENWSTSSPRSLGSLSLQHDPHNASAGLCEHVFFSHALCIVHYIMGTLWPSDNLVTPQKYISKTLTHKMSCLWQVCGLCHDKGLNDRVAERWIGTDALHLNKSCDNVKGPICIFIYLSLWKI